MTDDKLAAIQARHERDEKYIALAASYPHLPDNVWQVELANDRATLLAMVDELRAALEAAPELLTWDEIQANPGCEVTLAKYADWYAEYADWYDGPRAEALNDD